MEHIKQNDKRLYKVINKVGCFFRSCLLVAEYKENKELTSEQINNLWKYSKEHGYINDKDDVVKSTPIINQTLKELGNTKGHYYECATFKDGVIFWYPAISKDLRRIDSYIQKVQTANINTHFRVVNKYGDLIEDPYTPECRIKKIYYSICYGYVEEEG